MRERVVGLTVVFTVMVMMGGARDPGADELPRRVRIVFASTTLPVGTAAATSLPKALGYWKAEGLDVEVTGAAGSLPSLQMVLGGKADVGVVQPVTLFQMRPKGAKVKAFYTFVRQNWFFPAVLESSPIRSIADFKGRRIGVQSLGASMIPFMNLALTDAGLNPERDVRFVAVGLGAGAAALLQQGQVDALALWSAQYATMENAGFRLRKFTDIAPLRDLSFAVAFVARDEWLRTNRRVAVGLGRGWAKATLFALHNPEAAVRLHWKLFPRTTIGDNEVTALRHGLHELRAGIDFMRIDRAGVRLWGMTTPDEVESYGRVLLRAGLIGPPLAAAQEYFTSEFIDGINGFDAGLVIKQAKEYGE